MFYTRRWINSLSTAHSEMGGHTWVNESSAHYQNIPLLQSSTWIIWKMSFYQNLTKNRRTQAPFFPLTRSRMDKQPLHCPLRDGRPYLGQWMFCTLSKKIPICTLLHGSFEKYHFIKNITKIEDQLIIIYLLIRLPLKVAGQLG